MLGTFEPQGLNSEMLIHRVPLGGLGVYVGRMEDEMESTIMGYIGSI